MAPPTKPRKSKKTEMSLWGKTNFAKLPKGTKTTPGGWVKHDDDARDVAFANNGKLNTDQVRILRTLFSQEKEMPRKELSILSGPGPQCGKRWLDSLWQLQGKKLITITVGDTEKGHKQHYHRITARGRNAIKLAEKVAGRGDDARETVQVRLNISTDAEGRITVEKRQNRLK
jgi:hypothetical protein